SNLIPNEPDYKIISNISYGYITILLITIFLMDIVRKNVFSYYKWFKPSTNENGIINFQKN
ncbi:hypothetical protein, partial [Xanthovirga aplysinae]|uniref:hypothetical protein n=1 Tax=Xanthovirga aplysinae TaxID=2529853 RepID=UPI001CA3F000